jgi:hypothetical protein
MGAIFFGSVIGLIAWLRVRQLAAGSYTINPNGRALFNVLETQNIIGGEANITLIPRNSELLGQLVTATQTPKIAPAK